ncbi:dihydrodipicolinate reductase [Frankia sp. CNm7]|uniref:Dihydrodipicolinate reductase n=1 Tax=Frankia nepalensis TaxID=1836974 RepID=A0A937RJW4_9ACTN|nr:dihydrodipicolinate reductase [Frankia nepalensis]MBL7500187.1 dihydrodipicolinate reductase [Frankia nepalensis]MBL7509433.1 dihydrodipicolinate reductase [Frankia nepalensis]MBL7524809.1 dihydrodipicolinate reductase [Frankia nepalensis]MBL7631617.1 dihydrodipicolinate reductase [Frankia nepalensis]
MSTTQDIAQAPLRVVQWATGNIGTRSLRAVIEHPALELVGLYVYSADKAGKDAGELAGLDTVTGVAATTSIDDVVALGADCVLYMPARLDVDEVCRLLESGANIVTTRGEFHRPASIDPALRGRVEKACAAGGTSIHSTGSSPGFISEALPLVISSIQRRLDRLVINEYADMSRRDSPDMLFNLMGYGRPLTEFDERRAAHLCEAFGPSLALVADAVGKPLDEITGSGELAVAKNDLEIAAGTIRAGTVAAQRITVTGRHAGTPFLQFRANWYCTTDLDVDWELQDTGWRVIVEGDAPLDISLRFPLTLEQMAATTPSYTANRPVNAIAAVVAAAPGIRTTLDLPPIIGLSLA